LESLKCFIMQCLCLYDCPAGSEGNGSCASYSWQTRIHRPQRMHRCSRVRRNVFSLSIGESLSCYRKFNICNADMVGTLCNSHTRSWDKVRPVCTEVRTTNIKRSASSGATSRSGTMGCSVRITLKHATAELLDASVFVLIIIFGLRSGKAIGNPRIFSISTIQRRQARGLNPDDSKESGYRCQPV